MKHKIKLFVICTILFNSGMAFSAKPIKLSPSGDQTGDTDRAEIQAAFDAAGSSTAAKIKLSAGTFYINGGVSAIDFNGTFFGTGQANTKIVAVGEGDVANRGSVFLFRGGDVTIKNLTIEVPEGSSYLDSNPRLGTSDGGAAIDIVNGAADIKNIEIISNGPFGPFGEESLETGILLQGCYGEFALKHSHFERVKRSFIFNPVDPSECDISIVNNDFMNNRGDIFFLTPTTGGNVGSVTVSGNTFADTLVGPVFASGFDYPMSFTDNEFFGRAEPSANAAFDLRSGSGPLLIGGNEIGGQYFGPSIQGAQMSGGLTIADNRIDGGSINDAGSIVVFASDNITVAGNDFTQNTLVTGWDETDLTKIGAYLIIESTNVSIQDEMHSESNLLGCQVLHIPTIDPSNDIDSELIECVSSN